jgi:hypothetical protein
MTWFWGAHVGGEGLSCSPGTFAFTSFLSILPKEQKTGISVSYFAHLFLGELHPLHWQWAKKLFTLGEKKNCLIHTNDIFIFNIWNVFFYFDRRWAIFFYVICIREPENRELSRLGLVVHWFRRHLCVIYNLSVFWINDLGWSYASFQTRHAFEKFTYFEFPDQ